MKSFQNCPGSSSCAGAGQAHQPLLEPLLFQRSRERLLEHEDDPVAAAAMHG
jgi:hypothetical protein